MDKKQSQIKINLSNQFKKMVKKRATRFGVTMASYAKYLMMRDIEESEDLQPSVETSRNLKLAKNGVGKWYKPRSIKELDSLVDGVG